MSALSMDEQIRGDENRAVVCRGELGGCLSGRTRQLSVVEENWAVVCRGGKLGGCLSGRTGQLSVAEDVRVVSACHSRITDTTHPAYITYKQAQ